jgi:hypothetical protein
MPSVGITVMLVESTSGILNQHRLNQHRASFRVSLLAHQQATQLLCSGRHCFAHTGSAASLSKAANHMQTPSQDNASWNAAV